MKIIIIMKGFVSTVKDQIAISMGQGFTLIEVLTALTAIVIISTAVGSVVISSLSNARHTEHSTLAIRYAQEGIEAIHQIRKNNNSILKTYSGTYCLGNISDGLTSRPPACNTPNVGGNFIRTVEINNSSGCGTDLAKVIVMVVWSDEKCASSTTYCHNESISSCFSTRGAISAP